jgi:hypothetical protein
MFFEFQNQQISMNLSTLHPSLQILAKLRDFFVDRVDPMMKIWHLPTFYTACVDGVQNPLSLSKSMEAAMFAFYIVTISTLKEEESQQVFGVQKSIMYAQYRSAARQALVNAGFLSTSNLMTLRAYAIFMVSSKI